MNSYDVVVVGAGMAGSAVCARLATTGRSVLLLDTAAEPSAGGNTALSGGGLHIARLSLDADPARLRRRMLYSPAGLVREELADAISANAARAFSWLLDQGVQFEPESPGDIAYHFAPHRQLSDLHAWRDQGPQLMLKCLHRRFTAGGGQIRGGTRARELVRGAEGGYQIITGDGDRIAARSVVLADGGFQANLELRRRFIGTHSDRIFLRAAGNGQGDGLLMAEALGAQLSNTELFYGHCLHAEVVHNDRLWPWPALDELLTDGGILVDRQGRRITDEGKGGPAAANVVARLDDPLSTFVIVDEAMWGRADEVVWGHLATNRELTARGATIHRGATAAELAQTCGIDPVGLTSTLEDYNRALAAGRPDELPIARTGTSAPLAGALLAVPLIPGITHSLGGAVIDPQGRVLDNDNEPIPGLYAAGPTATGPHGSYFGGLATALVQGLLAAESIDSTLALPAVEGSGSARA